MEGKRRLSEESTNDENVNGNGKRRRKTEQLQRKAKPVIDYKWNCNHCDRSFAYGSIQLHMLKIHKTELESSNFPAKDHFTRGELKRKQDGSNPVTNYKWICNHCDRSLDHYNSMKPHMLAFHKDKLEFSNLSAKDHFTKGELRSNSTRVVDYKWNCNHCDRSFVYYSMKPHMLTLHKTELESSNLSAKDHFTKGELRTAVHRKELSGGEELRSSDEDSEDDFLGQVEADSGINGEELQDSGNEFPVLLPSSKIQESDDDNFDTSDSESMVFSTNEADDSAVDVSEPMNGEADNLFESESESESEDANDPTDYKWKCNFCSKEVFYEDLKCHLISVHKKSKDISTDSYFTRGELNQLCKNRHPHDAVQMSIEAPDTELLKQKLDFENQIQKMQREIDISNRINDHQCEMNRRLERELAIALLENEHLKAIRN